MTSTISTISQTGTAPPPGRMRARVSNVERFLADRGLEPAWLTQVLTTAVGPGQLLLTSSPVHGLANPSSDVDVIRITDGPLDGPRIATKIFERGHHLEVVSFTHGELERALSRLAELAALPPAECVLAARGWDRAIEPRRKQTERIVNGVTLAGLMPHLAALPDLATVWARLSLTSAVEHVAFLALAEAAGETRGRVGYAMNAVLHLVDALLSLDGDVYTTRKWFLLRWARARLAEQGPDGLRGPAATVDGLRALVAEALTDSSPLLPRYAEAAEQVAAAVTGTAALQVALRLRDGVTATPFLPGAQALVGPENAVLLRSADLPDGRRVRPAELARLPPDAARAALAAIRAGLAGIEVHHPVGTPGAGHAHRGAEGAPE
jgi:Family of unknown function (DUF6001)